AFQAGVRRFLERRAYDSATTDDLWAALGEGTGMNVGAMMDGWNRRTGLPVVLVQQEDGRLKLRQERFFLDRDPGRPSDDPTLWDIPLPMVDPSGKVSVHRLTERENVVEVYAKDGVKVNAGQTGFYLSHYDDAGWSALSKAVESPSLGAMDRYGLQE